MIVITNWLNSLKFFNGVNLPTVEAEMIWFCGGIFAAFSLCAFSMLLRATRGTISDVDL